MRSTTKSKINTAISAMAAAGLAAWFGSTAQAAQQTLSLSTAFIPTVYTGGTGTINGISYTDYYVAVLNNGVGLPLAGGGNNLTGSTIIAADLVISSPGTGTTGALYIASGHLGSTYAGSPFGYDPDGEPLTASKNVTNTPVYDTVTGDGATIGGGTFIGEPYGKALAYYGAYHVPSVTTAVLSGSQGLVYVNGNTQAGPPPPYLPYRSPFDTPAIYNSSVGKIDSNFTNGTVHDLEVIFSGGSALANVPYNLADYPQFGTDGTAVPVNGVPLANIVVPTGTPFAVQGLVLGETGQGEYINTSAGAGFHLYYQPPTYGNPVGPDALSTGTITGGSGAPDKLSVGQTAAGQYTPVEDTGITPIQKGTFAWGGFQETGDAAYCLVQFVNTVTGSDPFPNQALLNDLIAYINADGTADDEIVSPVSPSLAAAFPGQNFDLMITLTNAPSGDPYGEFDFSNFTSANGLPNPTLAVTGLALVPEPASIAVLALGGAVLLARRRRR